MMPARVRRVEHARDLPRDLGDAAPTAARRRREPPRERLALEQLHDRGTRCSVVEAAVEDLHDAGVLDLADGARLVEEALHVIAVLGDVGVEQLDRDGRLQILVLRAIDLAHAASAEPLHDPEVTDRLPDHPVANLSLAAELHAGGRDRGAVG